MKKLYVHSVRSQAKTAAWKEFNCPTCGVLAGENCRQVNKGIGENTNGHRARKRLANAPQ